MINLLVNQLSSTFLSGIFDCNTELHATPFPIFYARKKAAHMFGKAWFLGQLFVAFSPLQIKAQLLCIGFFNAHAAAGLCRFTAGMARYN